MSDGLNYCKSNELFPLWMALCALSELRGTDISFIDCRNILPLLYVLDIPGYVHYTEIFDRARSDRLFLWKCDVRQTTQKKVRFFFVLRTAVGVLLNALGQFHGHWILVLSSFHVV